MLGVGTQERVGGRSRTLPERSPRRVCPQGGVKEGAHGGTTGSPVMEQVEPRRNFIESNAKDVRFLDV
jgi:hypothetical protein